MLIDMSTRRFTSVRRPVLRRGSPTPDACAVCGGEGADIYLWCRPCIKRAAEGAARYFMRGSFRFERLDGSDLDDAFRRQVSRYEKRFERRLRRERGGPPVYRRKAGR